jgi:hypothetical protein
MQPPTEENNCTSLEHSDVGEKLAMNIAPPIGRTSRSIYWSVVLGSFLALAMLVTAIAHGGVAVAAAVTVPINATFGTLTLTNTNIQTAVADTGFVTITRTNVFAIHVTQTITVDFPGIGPITIRVTIARLAIRGLVNPVTIPGGSVPGLATPAIFKTTVLWDSATFEGMTVSIIRP